MNIKINNLKKQYDDRVVLNIDNLNIRSGKITGLVGANGSGKTTFLKLVAGLDNEYDGEIVYNNNKINEDIQKKLTLVFQKPYMLKTTVYENIKYPLKIRKLPKEEMNEKVEKILDKLKIDNLKNKKANSLSGGEGQKVAMARALVFEPEIILLDEPTSNIDKESTELIEREILNYNKESDKTVIIITHDINQAKRICDDIIVLNDGRVVTDGIL